MSDLIKINLVDLSQELPPTPVTVQPHTAGVTLVIEETGDVLDLFFNAGEITLHLYPNGVNADTEPTVLYRCYPGRVAAT